MSKVAAETNDTEYTPPQAAWRLPLYIEATPAEIESKTVECKTCPVYMLCETSEGGTGWTCPTCNTTGVWVDAPEGNNIPNMVLAIDCGKHKFKGKKEAENITKCALCSGEQMEMEVLVKKPTTFYVLTAYTKVPYLERQKDLKEKYDYWKKFYAENPQERK